MTDYYFMVDSSSIKFGKIRRESKANFQTKNLKNLSKFESISPPSVFIGSKLQYPLVNVGILSPVGEFEDAKAFDDCRGWANSNVSIRDVLNYRSNLLNSRFQSRVEDVRMQNKFLDIAKDIALASRPVDVEIELKNKVSSGMGRNQVLTPHGMKAGLKDVRVTCNVKIDKIVDRVVNDELKAVEGMNILYNKGINEYDVSKILSVGVMGESKSKKLVPTRWSITATDDTLSREIMERVRTYPDIQDYELFFGEFLGNQYLILLFPHMLSFELFELYYPGSSWNPGTDFRASHDYESFEGRKNYADNCGGGYYATRLPIMEYLDKIKRQAGILAIRLETPSYWAGLGVWVVRESVRKAMGFSRSSDRKAGGFGMRFGDREEFLNSVKNIAKIKYDFDIQEIYDRSWYLKEILSQSRLKNFF
jgi:hypothetical protein